MVLRGPEGLGITEETTGDMAETTKESYNDTEIQGGLCILTSRAIYLSPMTSPVQQFTQVSLQ